MYCVVFARFFTLCLIINPRHAPAHVACPRHAPFLKNPEKRSLLPHATLHISTTTSTSTSTAVPLTPTATPSPAQSATAKPQPPPQQPQSARVNPLQSSAKPPTSGSVQFPQGSPFSSNRINAGQATSAQLTPPSSNAAAAATTTSSSASSPGKHRLHSPSLLFFALFSLILHAL